MPAGHPLRSILPVADAALAALSGEFQQLYAVIGRPSIAPEKLLRALLLQAFYSLRSERQLMEQLDYNLLFRWFVGLGVDDAIWDATVFTKNRDRLLEGEKSSDGWMCRCPAHGDLNPSLKISEADDGKPLWHCHAGCSQETVQEALQRMGIWEARSHRERRRRLAPAGAAARPQPPRPPLKAIAGGRQDNDDDYVDASQPAKLGKIVATYDYFDITGQLQFQVVRFHPKTFRQRRPSSCLACPSPALVEWGQRSIAAAGSFDEIRKVRALAEALAAFQKSIGAAEEAIAAAFEIRMRAERRMGEELQTGQERGEIAGIGTNQDDLQGVPGGNAQPATHAELGLTRKEAASYKALAKPSPEQFEAIVAEAKGGRMSQTSVVDIARKATENKWSLKDITRAVREQVESAHRKEIGLTGRPPADAFTAASFGYKSDADILFSTTLRGAIQDVLEQAIKDISPDEAAARLSQGATLRMRRLIDRLLPWLSQLRDVIKERKDAA